jgi:hypothetical protein
MHNKATAVRLPGHDRVHTILLELAEHVVELDWKVLLVAACAAILIVGLNFLSVAREVVVVVLYLPRLIVGHGDAGRFRGEAAVQVTDASVAEEVASWKMSATSAK